MGMCSHACYTSVLQLVGSDWFSGSLFLDNINMTVTLPEILGCNLQSLDLHGNNLSGPIPPSASQLTLLWILNLAYNALTGT